MNAFERLRNGGRAAGDEGFTLVELLVTMLITGIVLTMLGTFFANISRLTSWSGKDRDATGQAALALDAVRAVVRVATDNPSSPTTTDTAVQAGTGSQLSIIAYSNTSVNAAVPVLVTFTLSSSGDLTERRQLGTLNPAGYYRFTGPITTSTVATGFQPAAANPFFTYLDRSSTKLPATGGLSAANRANVTFIQVTTTLDPQTAGGPDGAVVVTTSIGMPNLARDVAATVAVPNLPTPTETPTPTPTPTRVTPPPTSTPVSTPTPTTGSSGGSGTGTGSGSGTATPPASGGGGGSTGGGSGTSTPAPTSTTPKPTATATATPTPAPKPTATPKPPVVIDQ